MFKNNLEENGFSAVEGLLVLVIIILVGAVGYLVYKNHQDTKNTSTSISKSKVVSPVKTTTTDPYTGWDSYTLKNENASFKYPSNWLLTDSSNNGQDMVELNAPDSFYLNLDTVNLGHPSVDYPTSIVLSTPLTFVGQNGYINYFSATTSSTSSTIDAELSMNSTSIFDSLFPTKNLNPSGVYSISLGNKNNPITLTSIKSDTSSDFKNTKLILQSIKY